MLDFEDENNMEALLWKIENEKERPYKHSFLETNEDMLLDDIVYRQMQFNDYSFAVRARSSE